MGRVRFLWGVRNCIKMGIYTQRANMPREIEAVSFAMRLQNLFWDSSSFGCYNNCAHGFSSFSVSRPLPSFPGAFSISRIARTLAVYEISFESIGKERLFGTRKGLVFAHTFGCPFPCTLGTDVEWFLKSHGMKSLNLTEWKLRISRNGKPESDRMKSPNLTEWD